MIRSGAPVARCIALAALSSALVLLAGSAHAATFVVNSLSDATDQTPGNGVCATTPPTPVCTLRAALQEANALAGADIINFNIGGGGPQTISPGSAYPLITTVVTIDGTTQPGWAGTPIIELNGAGAGGANALSFSGAGTAGSTVRGLVIGQFGAGIAIRILVGCSNIVVAGNYLGTDPTGALARPNAVGVFVQNATLNRIGGTVAADRNVISGNSPDGIQIVGAGATGNLVQGNYIGLDSGGTADLGNVNTGVAIFNGASSNTVGGTAAGAGNVISGNNLYGVGMSQAGTTANRVEGNRIGTNAAGLAAVGNAQGVATLSSATGNTIGGTAAGARNVISGNASHGVVVGAGSTQVQGNYIGTNAAGTAAVPNGADGVSVQSSSGSTVGGSTAAARNVVSGNADDGIEITGATATGNLVQGNYVGLNAAGTGAIGNANDGIVIWLGQNNTIAVNVVGGNQSGLYLGDATATGNSILGNLIGTDATGLAAVGNITGIYLDAASTTVGGMAAGAGNVISGNTWAGLWIAGASGVVAQANLIGLGLDGITPVGNRFGVYLDSGASGNTIGGTVAGAGNVIARNTDDAIVLVSTAGSGNRINRNSIYSNGGLAIDLDDDGVTANDTGDVDAGPNGLQNFPVLSAAVTNGAGSANFAGSLAGAASTTYRIELFASSAADPSGFGEGQRYLGFTDVTTNAAGSGIIGVTLAASLTAGELVTATATDPGNSTSEFSATTLAYGVLIVTTTADTVDGVVTSVSNLIANPGADGRISLREAIRAANATAGTDTIRFGIPLTDANHLYYRNDAIAGSLTNVQATPLADSVSPSSPAITDFDPDYVGTAFSWYRIRPTAVLPTIGGAVVLDGYTQPGARANAIAAPGLSDAIHKVELDGTLAGAVNGIPLTAGGSTIRGLVVNRFGAKGMDVSGGGSNLISGNYFGSDVTGTRDLGNVGKGIEIWSAGNTVGGTTPADRNLVSGNDQAGISLRNAGATGNLVAGNFVGTDVRGTLDLGNSEDGVRFSGGASSNTIGGTVAGARNVISGNDNQGITFWAATDAANVIEGNYVGLNAAGTAALPNGTPATPWGGIGLDGSGNRIGGTAAGAGNVISGNRGVGIEVYSSGHIIQGNLIGTDASGTGAVPNTTQGLFLYVGVGNSTVGGTAVGAGNTIAFNGADGVSLDPGAGTGNAILGNRIHSNGGLGIDLAGDGVTPNDLNVNDADTGPNDLMNFPSFPPPVETAGTLSVTYGLDLAAGWYRIEFFKNPAGADPSGYGEGQTLARSVVVNHPGGRAAYGTTFAGSAGDVISATTTLCSDGASCAVPASTSEFGRAWAAVTTAVELYSFAAVPGDGSVRLEWRTASELDNLGFFLYRSLSEVGPWSRITPTLIPGLGSSPVGASYSWDDTGLLNDTRYHYRLEDIDTASLSTFHGPVSAVPRTSSTDDEGDPGSGGEESGDNGSGEIPAWDALETYGDPTQVSLRVVARNRRQAVIELRTGGFYARRDAEGNVRVFVPGFDQPSDPHAPALPFRRVLLDGVVGRGARLRAVRVEDRVSFSDLVPASVGYAEMEKGADGTVRPVRRRASRRADGATSRGVARLRGAAFQGERKKVVLELSPLRYDDAGGRLILARRILVKVTFAGREARETGSGHVGRRRPRARRVQGRTLAFLHTSQRGLHAVSFESLFAGRTRPLALSSFALRRQDEAVPFHVEPATASFGPGSVLYFYADGQASSTAFTGELAYELVRQAGGATMASASAAPTGAPIVAASRGRQGWEVNRIYQPGLLEAGDPWLWVSVFGGASRTVTFTLGGLDTTAPGSLSLFLQGGSDAESVVDHHLRIAVNGVPVGETRFDGKAPHLAVTELAAAVLREGENTLTIENAGDTGVWSVVYLDRFEVDFPQAPALRGGLFEGVFFEGGVATLGPAPSAVALDVTDPPSPVWLRSYESGPDSVRLRAEAGHRYLVVSPEGMLSPRVAPAVPSDLASEANQADYVLIAPEEFLAAAGPLLERRQSQGLTTRAVALEEIAAVFGHGQSSGEAIRSFLTHAFHSWRPPSPRYVLLLGDASRDPRNFTGSAEPAPLPVLWAKTSYLWTASDPTLAAVNGEDELPDLALGRLPATTEEQARALVAKVLDWEDSGQGLGGAAVLVADDPDPAGDFEADVDDIHSSFLSGRPTTTIRIREQGSLTRAAILDAFDRGASLVSYVGHGGSAVWASENVLNSWDAAALTAQSRQPLMLTLNCLNGYFVGSTSDSLAEAFLKVEGRGTIAAFSPSGLSVDGPAHLLHRALMAEITSGRHDRLGDAVLAAQEVYADSGVMPELLTIYHLFGDPAMLIR